MAKRLSEKRASAQCCVRGSTQFCWRRSWGVIPASFGLCRENKGVGLVLVWDIYPQGSGLHILYLYKRWHGRAVWCCLLKCSGVVCGWHVTHETAPFLRSVWRTPTLEQQISFYNCARSISLSAQRLWALKSRKRQLWLEWAEPVNLTVVLWAGTKLIAFRISEFRISPSLSLGLHQLPESRISVIPIGHVGQKRKLCCRWRGSTSVRGHWGAVMWWAGSALSPLQEAEVAISARQFATSLAVSVQLYCEMSLAAKPKEVFFLLWRVIFKLDHSAIQLRAQCGGSEPWQVGMKSWSRNSSSWCHLQRTCTAQGIWQDQEE